MHALQRATLWSGYFFRNINCPFGRGGAHTDTPQLVKLLCRLYEPTEGTITLNGIDIWKYNYAEYTRAFSVVFQDFAMFSLPVGENIAASSKVDEERAWEVLDQVELSGRVRAMKDGLKTQLYNNNGAGVDISGGEAQRIKLATELSRRSTGKTVYILDEPTTGLHFADVHKLTEILRRLAADGNTVIVIEHNLDVVKVSDYLIDIGQEGGSGGGRLIATGTPEQVASVKKSYTGQFLKPLLKR